MMMSWSSGSRVDHPSAFVVRDVQSAGAEIFGAQADWHSPGSGIHGAAIARTSRKAALQYAAVSLLGHLSGVEPVEPTGETEKGWVPAARHSAGSAPAQARDQSFATRLQRALAQPRVAPAVVAEVATRISARALIPRDLHTVLYEPASSTWEPARNAALQAAGAEPGTAVAVLTLYQSLRNRPNPVFAEGSGSGLFRARVTCVIDDESVTLVSPWHPNKRHARGAAALQILADLAELPIELPPARHAPTPAPSTVAVHEEVGPLGGVGRACRAGPWTTSLLTGTSGYRCSGPRKASASTWAGGRSRAWRA
ncbi:hypothetical protein [Streptomyces sp. NBC_00019]|uniref:hypothetical protein n=1 Tax=Streptomyces sp. NBC_00019 TaxID=2975623 RepID=UPI003865299C